MVEVSNWDAWAWRGNLFVNRPGPNCTPERALALLLKNVWLLYGEQDWNEWGWELREYAHATPRTLRFCRRQGAWLPTE